MELIFIPAIILLFFPPVGTIIGIVLLIIGILMTYGLVKFENFREKLDNKRR